MRIRHGFVFLLGLTTALAGVEGLAAPKKKKRKKKAPVQTEETAGAEAAGTEAGASGNYGMAGCGLGSVVFGNKPGKMTQLFAATLNATGMQVFAITSGTSNCTTGTAVAENDVIRQQQFVASNLQALSKDAARGDGATLRAFSETLGCESANYQTFAALSQLHYQEIFAEPSAHSVWQRYVDYVKQSDALGGICAKVS